MKKLIMFVMVVAIATPAVALVYPDKGPNFTGCENSAWIVWEFLDDFCLPTSTDYDPAYAYNPITIDAPTFGSRHFDPVGGWGSNEDYEYGDAWQWDSDGGNGTFEIWSEDSINQSIPARGDKRFLRQYFQIVHTEVPGLGETAYQWPIGLGVEIWDLSIYESDGWTGCPTGYENLPAYGYLDGYEAFTVPDSQEDLGGGWVRSIWIYDFSIDGSVYTGDTSVSFGELYEATHTTCIIGMDLDPDEGEIYKIQEATLDFIWFDAEDYSDIPVVSCIPRDGGKPAFDVTDVDIPIYEPQDPQGPPVQGPTSGTIKVRLAWQPGEDLDYPEFTAKVLVDPDPNQELTYDDDFRFPDSTEPNDNITLTFTQANWDVYQDITITATADLAGEGDESSNVEIRMLSIDIIDPNFGADPCGPAGKMDPCNVVSRSWGVSVADNDIPHISVDPYDGFLDVFTENDPCVEICVDVRLSHMPDSDVYLLVERTGGQLLLNSMTIWDPNYFEAEDPNRLIFTPGDYNIPQQICLEARDDEERPEGDEWIQGEITFTPYSEDLKYCVEGIHPRGYDIVQDPCIPGTEESGGWGEAKTIYFNVEDNECGAWGYDAADTNEDCFVDLGEIAALYGEWLFCTLPYDRAHLFGPGVPSLPPLCDKSWNLVD